MLTRENVLKCGLLNPVHSLKGLVLSGDSFMSDPNRVLELKQMFQSPACAEMEAGAIAQVCHQFEILILMLMFEFYGD